MTRVYATEPGDPGWVEVELDEQAGLFLFRVHEAREVGQEPTAVMAMMAESAPQVLAEMLREVIVASEQWTARRPRRSPIYACPVCGLIDDLNVPGACAQGHPAAAMLPLVPGTRLGHHQGGDGELRLRVFEDEVQHG